MSLDKYDRPDGSYTSAIPSGMKAFREVTSEFFGFPRTEVIRDASRCQQQRSEHCECGGVDEFTTDPVKGRRFFDWCVKVSVPLGVQSVIFRDREIGFGNPTERHRAKQDHFDHVHVGLNRWARKNLTEQAVRSLLPGAEEEDMTPEQDARLKAVEKAVFKKGSDGVTYEHLTIVQNMLTAIGAAMSPPVVFDPDGTRKP